MGVTSEGGIMGRLRFKVDINRIMIYGSCLPLDCFCPKI